MDKFQKRTKKIYEVVDACLENTEYSVNDLVDYDFVVTHPKEEDIGVMVTAGHVEIGRCTDGRDPEYWDMLLRIQPEGELTQTACIAHAIASFIKCC